MADPITSTAAVISAANSLRAIFGGGSKQSSVLQGYEITGELSSAGLRGTSIAFDQLGNKWAFPGNEYTADNGSAFAGIFNQSGLPTDDRVPLSFRISAAGNYDSQLLDQLSASVRARVAARGTPATAAPPATQPGIGDSMNQFLMPTASSMSAPTAKPTQAGTPAGAVPVGGIAPSATPSSAAAASALPWWVWVIAAAIAVKVL